MHDAMNQVNFFKSKGGGQFFKRQGDAVKVICLYDFNPSVERTHFSEQLLSRLQCEPCSESEFSDAEQRVARLLELPVFPFQQRA
jgi:hypothetical protein